MFINRMLSWAGYKVVRAFPGEVSSRGHITNFIISNPELFKGKILDLGSGSWTLVRDTYQNVTTFDIVPPADVVGDAQELSKYFVPNSFDTVGAFELFEHLADPRKVIEQLRIVLKPGGTFIGATPFMYPLHGEEYGDYWRFTRQGWKLLLGNFEDVHVLWNGNELQPSHYIVTARKPNHPE